MELAFILIYFLVTTVLIAVAYLYRSIAVLALILILLTFLGISILTDGYDRENSFSTYNGFNYTYFPTSNTQEVTGFNLTKTLTYTAVRNNLTNSLGISILALGAITFFMGWKYVSQA